MQNALPSSRHRKRATAADAWRGITGRNVARPYPGKIGDGSQPALLSSNADGIHSANSRHGPQIIGNTLSGNGDDAIAVHGTYLLVAAADASRNAVTLALSQPCQCALLSCSRSTSENRGPCEKCQAVTHAVAHR